jgi:hypothetical protein
MGKSGENFSNSKISHEKEINGERSKKFNIARKKYSAENGEKSR